LTRKANTAYSWRRGSNGDFLEMSPGSADVVISFGLSVRYDNGRATPDGVADIAPALFLTAN
jgi:hypothetical protein